MANIWSFNTTVRNPERMQNMLRALSELEGKEFDLDGQREFFGLQIKKRLYKPTKLKLAEQDLIEAVYSENSADDLEDATVERILQKYDGGSVDASGRGRTAAGILNRFGLCTALQSKGAVLITELGKNWLIGEIDDDELFTKFFLKWQYPNPIESGYADFNIKPFVGVLSLIDKVNAKWAAAGKKPVGVSKGEYLLYAPSLSVASEIDRTADELINFREQKESKSGNEQKLFIKAFTQKRLTEIFGSGANLVKAASDLRDYTDSSVRYFRMSGLISLRGGNTHIDIAHDKKVEAISVINSVNPSAREFASYDEYLEYLSDISAVELPWRNEDDLKKITLQLSRLLAEESDAKAPELGEQPLIKQVDALQNALNNARLQKLRDLKHNVEVLDECISRLEAIGTKQYEALTARPSLDLEWYVSRALMVMNDAEKIVPSFKIGDDGIPTGFRANTSDIECYYQSFGMTVEVTLLLGRDQWYAEGQPVQRHLRDFEDKLGKDSSYCIFVAPLIHRDTVNTFWGANKMKYEGKQQNIIPLTIKQFIDLLTAAKQKIADGSLTHIGLEELLQNISQSMDEYEVPNEWLNKLPEFIKAW